MAGVRGCPWYSCVQRCGMQRFESQTCVYLAKQPASTHAQPIESHLAQVLLVASRLVSLPIKIEEAGAK
jgi:hypothetical protein